MNTEPMERTLRSPFSMQECILLFSKLQDRSLGRGRPEPTECWSLEGETNDGITHARRPLYGRRFLSFLFAIFYGYMLVSLDGKYFFDRDNYLAYATKSHKLIDEYLDNGGVVGFLSNEPIWLYINQVLGNYLEPIQVVDTIIFVSACTMAFTILSFPRISFILGLLFLMNLQIAKNYTIHLRQGTALALFTFGWTRVGPAGWGFRLLGALTHTSILILEAIFLMVSLIHRFKWSGAFLRLNYLILTSIVTVSLVSVGGYFGARQSARYGEQAASMTGLGLGFWLVVLLLFLVQGKEWLRNNGAATSVLIAYVLLSVTSEFGARVLESGLVVIYLSGLQLPANWRTRFVSLYLVYVATGWLLAWQKPMFGWVR